LADPNRFDAFIANAKAKKQGKPDYSEVLKNFNAGKTAKTEKVEKAEKVENVKSEKDEKVVPDVKAENTKTEKLKQPTEDFLS